MERRKLDLIVSGILFFGSLGIIALYLNNNAITGNIVMDFGGDQNFLLSLFIFLSLVIIGYIIYAYKNP